MDATARVGWFVTTLLGLPFYFFMIWQVRPYFEFEPPYWLDALFTVLLMPVVLVGALVLVAYALRDLQRTKSIGAALFGFYMLAVGAAVVILAHVDVYEHYGLIQTFTSPASMPNPLPLTKADYIYFSIITWTTVGYGDLIPSPNSRPFAAEEALFGYIYMAAYIGYTLNAVTFLSEYDFSFPGRKTTGGATDAKPDSPTSQQTDPPKT